MLSFKTSDKNAVALFRSAFPNTKFRQVRIQAFRGPMSLNSYWDSGCRDYFQIVRISDGQPIAAPIPQNGTVFDGKNLELSALPEGYAVAMHVYSGCNQYGYLYLNAENITKMLPEAAVAVAS